SQLERFAIRTALPSERLSAEQLGLLIFQGLLRMQVSLHSISDPLPELRLTSISP
ncbi:hypothetical protein Tco_0623507, partial [Tanacetum coccineum]